MASKGKVFVLEFYRIATDKAYGELFIAAVFSSRENAEAYYKTNLGHEKYYKATPAYIREVPIDGALYGEGIISSIKP